MGLADPAPIAAVTAQTAAAHGAKIHGVKPHGTKTHGTKTHGTKTQGAKPTESRLNFLSRARASAS
jgi:hypothetical protein